MAETDTLDSAPSPADAAAATGALSGGTLPLTPAGAGTPSLASTAPAAAAPPEAQHSAVGRVFHGILDTLSGGSREPQMDASGQITEAPVHRTGGEWARRILAGALTGAASGAAAPARPGAGAIAGLGAGFMGEQEALAGQDAAKRAALQKNFANKQAAAAAVDDATIRKAQIAHLTNQNAADSFELVRQKRTATNESVNAYNEFQKLLGADPQAVDLGVFPDMNAVMEYRKTHPELAGQLAGNHESGMIQAVPAVGPDGNYIGVHAALVHPSLNDRPLSDFFEPDKMPAFQYRVAGGMGADGKMQPDKWETATFAPSTPFGVAMTMNQKTAQDATDSALKDAQLRHENAGTTGEELSNRIKRNELANPAGGTGGPVDEIGRPLALLDPDPAKSNKMRETRRTAFGKDYVKDANQLEQSYKQMGSILDRAAKGQMTGPDSVVGLFNAIGISSAPLKGRGFRIGKEVTGEHVGARNIWQGMQARLSALTPNGTGEVVTPEQLQGYQTILSQARHDMYVTMAQEAQRQGLAKDFLPRATGQNQQIDPGTARIFLDSYGGDAALARKAAATFGWAIPGQPASNTVQ